MSQLYDITIVGGGPVGLFAAFYAHLRQAKVQIIDSLPQLGGQPAILYPEKQILDVPGFPNLTGEELTNRLLEQLKGKPRPLELDGVDSYENIHYHVSNIQQYAGKKVTILGGGDSAVDWALAFEKIAPTTLVHRRDNFRALEHSVQALQESSVTIKTPFIPSQLVGDGQTLNKLEITKVKSDESETIEVDHLFVNYGFKSSVGNLKNWGLDLNRHKIIVNSKQESSLSGIYAIGDCCYYEGKIDLIATGLGEAPTAVNNAINYIDPEQKVQPKHSTSL